MTTSHNSHSAAYRLERSRLACTAITVAGSVLLLAAGCGGPARDVGEPVTFSSMLASLTNVAEFAVAPRGVSKMESSYDRTGGNNDWRVWNAGELQPDGLVDLAVLNGPGCVTRIWMTSVPADEWLFFFDGEPEPRLRCTTDQLFGGRAPFLPPLANRLSGGFYSYVPLPYAKSLRIAVRPTDFSADRKPYYQVNYTEFPRGTPVETFPGALGTDDEAVSRDVLAAWGEKARYDDGEAATAVGEIELAPGREVEWLRADAGGVLRNLALSPVYPDGISAVDRARALREMVLRMWWDDAAEPSADVPLGDFFCNAFYRRSFNSLPLANQNGTFRCAFPMPFARNARATLRNDGALPMRVKFSYRVEPRTVAHGAPQTYFHATWRSGREGGAPYEVLDVAGEGHFVGCYLNTIGLDGTWNILEGDERLFVDGEKFPSWHGTGLEDFFSGGWYYKGLYDLPLHGLLEKAPIRTDQYRFLLHERVRFARRFRIEFEFGAGDAARGYMSSTAYWYASKPRAAGSVIPPAQQRLHPPDPMMPSSIMAQLFELERAGRHDDAMERCRFYGETFARQPWSPLLLLRGLAYEERLSGFAAVKDRYAQCIAEAAPPIREQAAALTWFHAAPSNALAFVQATGPVKLFLQGRMVAEGNGVQHLHAVRHAWDTGKHEVVALVERSRGISWFSFALRTHGGILRTDGTWQVAYLREPPPDMSAASLDALTWTAATAPGMGEMLPTNSEFVFMPNAFVDVQSAEQLLRLWDGNDTSRPEPLVCLRKVWTVSETGEIGQNVP